jgi:hypothetical protein
LKAETRTILGEFETREEAEEFRDDLLAQDPRAEGLVVVMTIRESPDR